MSERYLKQVIVVRKDLSMPTGKLAAMVAHASMTFIIDRFRTPHFWPGDWEHCFTADEARWLTELDPGIEETGQVSMAKIVCQVASEAELVAIEQKAKASGLTCHRVVDSGYAHNKKGDFACVAIGPDWPEKLSPVTGGLKVYR